MIKSYNLVNQSNFIMYSVVLSADELINNTVVEYFDPEHPEENGYQRLLSPAHYRKIAKYLKEDSNAILPTSILTAVDPEQVVEGNELTITGKLRVVDGQHRIEGIKYLKKTDEEAFNKINKFNFSTLVMVISKEQKAYEIESFININKTGRKVSTDLAVQLKNKIIGESEKYSSNSIATKICEKLNSSKKSIWYNSIKLGNDTSRDKSISITAFNKSLIKFVENYIQYNEITNDFELNNSIDILSNFISEAWEVVHKKWYRCFNYLEDYNIKKGIGVFPLNNILGDQIKENQGNLDKSLESFEKIINQSNVNYTYWIKGGKFSGYNSQSGFKKIENIILNKSKS